MGVTSLIKEGRTYKMVDNKALELRKSMKKRKPYFVVKESKFSARVKSRWRFPRGKHSAVRQFHKGRPKMPTIGFSSPIEVKGLHPSGLLPVIVHNLAQMQSIDTKSQGVVIAASVGNRKKLQLLKYATGEKIKILNIKDTEALTKEIKDAFELRKKVRVEKAKDKSSKTEEKKKKAEEKKKKESEAKVDSEKDREDEESVEEKIQEEEKKQKQIMEKTITKRQ